MATMSIDELRRLKDKAVSYCASGGSTECKWLYRNKSEQYFEDILVNQNGTMKPYIKDNSGDQRSPINDRLNGLFFMARHEDGEPASASPFGPVRLLMPADELLGRCPNVYFTDFYCMQSNWHYVTLVVTSNYSLANSFCRPRLLPLNLYNEADNPFLFYRGGKLYVSNSDFFQVEIFYTDEIQVFQHGAATQSGNIFDPQLLVPCGSQLRVVPTFGRGSSTPGGLKKNTFCPLCNLQPFRLPVF